MNPHIAAAAEAAANDRLREVVVDDAIQRQFTMVNNLL
jgi:hypothetical protein